MGNLPNRARTHPFEPPADESLSFVRLQFPTSFMIAWCPNIFRARPEKSGQDPRKTIEHGA